MHIPRSKKMIRFGQRAPLCHIMLHSELSLHGLKLILVLLEQLQSQSEASVESESECRLAEFEAKAENT
jgi:hypothetical protein